MLNIINDHDIYLVFNLFQNWTGNSKKITICTGAGIYDFSFVQNTKVPSMSFYPDFIQILSRFYLYYLETHFILILNRFYPKFSKDLDKSG